MSSRSELELQITLLTALPPEEVLGAEGVGLAAYYISMRGRVRKDGDSGDF